MSLNNFDLATTRLYKGVKPMWEQLGFENNSFDVPEEHIYWQNIIPSNWDFSNLTGVSVQLESTIINDVDMVYFVATIDGDVEQEWEGGFHYPILPPVNKTCEPVISPLEESIKLLLELDIVFEFIVKPPICPAVAFIEPSKNALPLA